MNKYFTTALLIVLAEKAYNEQKKLFLQNMFGLYNEENYVISTETAIKVIRYLEAEDNEPIPVGATDEGNSNTVTGFETIDASAPRFREKTIIYPQDLYDRVSHIKDPKKQKEEVLKIIKKELIKLAEVPNLAHEIYVARALQNSTLSFKVKEKGTVITKTIDLKSPSGHIKNYSTDATKKVLDVVKEGQGKIGKHYKANRLILGSDMVDKFLTEIGDKLNTRHIEGVEQKLNGLEVGQYRYHGRYDGMEVYECEGTYKSEGSEVAMINPKSVIVTSTFMEWKKYFGAIKDIDAMKGGKHIGKAFSKSWTLPDPSGQNVLLETDSIPVPTDSRGIYCATMA